MELIVAEGIERIILLNRADAPNDYPVDQLDSLARTYIFDAFWMPQLARCYSARYRDGPVKIRARQKNNLSDLRRVLGKSYRQLDQDAKDYWHKCRLPMAAVVHPGQTPAYQRYELVDENTRDFDNDDLAAEIFNNKISETLVLVGAAVADFTSKISPHFHTIHVVESEPSRFYAAMVECTRTHASYSNPLLNAAFVGHRSDWTPEKGCPPFRLPEGSDTVYYKDGHAQMTLANGRTISLDNF